MFNFPEHLKKIRKMKGATQKEVAEYLEITERNYQKIEAGDTKPSFDTLVSLAMFFELTLDYIAGNKGTNLQGACLQKAILERVRACGAIFLDADMSQTNIRDADLRCADLRRANLQDADLRGADLRGANLQDANLQGAILDEANFKGANVKGTILEGKIIDGKYMP
jgi:uncharacterized protein YjbI with pentapeptide repeats